MGALTAALLVSGCGASAETVDDPAGDPVTSSPTLDPDLRGTMTITPSTAAPGEQVALRFASKRVRGIAFSLAAWDGEQWEPAYYLTSDWGAPRQHEPDWWSVENSEGRGWVDVGIAGPGPDRVVVPDDAAPGDYLLCTANSVEESCELLAVVSSG